LKVVNDIFGMIGNTPLIKLRKITEGLDANIFVKCEYVNPSGSTKDRIALKMVEGAEKEGCLRDGGTVIEVSSGNTGPALAFVGKVKGYGVRLHIPSQWTESYNPENRVKLMRLFGADVKPIVVDEYHDLLKELSGQQYVAAIFGLGMKRCYDLERENDSFWWADQMSNPNNVLAHKEGTGNEIIEQLDMKIDAFVASIGTGGTLLGVAEALSSKSVNARIVGVEPQDAKVMEEWAETGFLNQFLGRLGMPRRKYIIEEMLEKEIPDEMMYVGHDEARSMANRLCQEEGILCGMSSGANVAAALRVAGKLGKGANVVTLCVDRRDRYYTEYPHETYVI
jgi:cysteine synthase A